MTEASKVETMRWRHNQLEMIDQRVLPMRFEYLSYTDADAIAEGLVARSSVAKPDTAETVGADEPLAEWEQELLATAEAAPAADAATETTEA